MPLWKPRPLPHLRPQVQAPSQPWQAWIDPQSGGSMFWDPSLTVFLPYDRPPHAGIRVKWLDLPPPQALRGTVKYETDDDDADSDDDPYGLFSEEVPSEEVTTLSTKSNSASNNNSSTLITKTNETNETTTTATTTTNSTSTSNSNNPSLQHTNTTTTSSKYAHTNETATIPDIIPEKTIRSTNSKVFIRKPSGKLGSEGTKRPRRMSSIKRLGSNWVNHDWEPPDIIQAQQAANASVYGLGRLPLWSTAMNSPKLSLEIRLYFKLLKHLSWTFLCMAILIVPIAITYASGVRFNTSNTNFLATLTPANLGLSETIVQHCSSDIDPNAFLLDPLDPPTLACRQALQNSTTLIVGVTNTVMSMSEFSVAVSILNTIVTCVFVLSFIFFWIITVRFAVKKEEKDQPSITHYAIKVSGFPSNTSKEELCIFFSDKFNPNNPGRLYDDGNRILDDQVIVIDETEEKKEEKTEKETEKEEKEDKATKKKNESIQFVSELKAELDLERKLKMEKAIKAKQRMRNRNSKGGGSGAGYSWRSKRRIIHHDGTSKQKQMFLPLINTDNTYEPKLYKNRFVAEVVMAYSGDGNLIRQYETKQRLLRQLHHNRATIQMYTTTYQKNLQQIQQKFPGENLEQNPSDLQKIEKARIYINEIKMELEQITQLVANEATIGVAGDRTAVAAFVVFQHETSYMRCIEAYHSSNTFWCRCCQPQRLRYPVTNGKSKPLIVTPAPDPQDILWENITTNNNNNKCKSWCLMIACLAISFGICILYYSINTTIIGTTVGALLFAIGNLIIQYWITKFAEKEQHLTKSISQSNVFWKTFVVLFINNGVILQLSYFAISRTTSARWYSEFGVLLLTTMFINIVSPHFVALLQLISRCRSCKSTCQKLWYARPPTQEDADDMLLGPKFSIAVRLATVMNTLATTLLYSSALPILLPIAFVSFMFTFWLDKIMLLRIYQCPPTHSHSSRKSKLQSMSLFAEIVPVLIVLHFIFAVVVYSDMHVFYSERVEDASYKTLGNTIGLWREKLGRASALPAVVALLSFLIVILIQGIVIRSIGNCMLRLKLCCVNVICGGDDDHYHAFQARRKKQSAGKDVHYINDSEDEVEAAQKYHTTRCCNGAAACRCLFSLLTVDGRFEGHPPFTEPCIITLRDSKGRPIRPPVETTQFHDLHIDAYLKEEELSLGWRLGLEKRRNLLYKTKVWTSKGQAFRRRHDEHTQMYTYEALLDARQAYTYNIHALLGYQQVLRSQLNAKRTMFAQREKEKQEAAAAMHARKVETEQFNNDMKALTRKNSTILARQRMPHEMEIELPTIVKLFDSEHTAYYFYNQITYESTWEQPADYNSPRHAYVIRWLLAERPRSALVIQQLFRKFLAKKVYHKHYKRVREEDVGAHIDGTGVKWRVRVDETNGKTFYQHDKHGARQWDKPGDWRVHGEENEQMSKVQKMINNLGK